MKMTWNWQVIINFILFAMIVTAFTLAIWSYVKTNAIKNSNSPSITNVTNDNNTYVNNISSAPTLVELFGQNGSEPLTYNLTSVDNGTIFVFKNALTDTEEHQLTLNGNVINDSKGNRINGFYVKIKNANLTGGLNLNIVGNLSYGQPNTFTLGPGQEVYYGQNVTSIVEGVGSIPPLTNSGFW